jgi:hypothetical protein
MSEKFYENISISRFDGKTRRMLKFRQKIEDLYAFLNE